MWGCYTCNVRNFTTEKVAKSKQMSTACWCVDRFNLLTAVVVWVAIFRRCGRISWLRQPIMSGKNLHFFRIFFTSLQSDRTLRICSVWSRGKGARTMAPPRYTSAPLSGSKMTSIACWKAPDTFFKPSSIRKMRYSSRWVVNTVLSWSISSATTCQ